MELGRLIIRLLLGTEDFEQNAAAAEQMAEELTTTLSGLADEVNGQLTDGMQALGTVTKGLQEGMEQLNGVFKDASGRLRDARGRFLEEADVLKLLENQANLTEEQLKDLNDARQKFADKEAATSAKALTGELKQMGEVINDVVVTGLKAGAAALLAFFGVSTAVGAQFEQQMKKVAVISEATEEEFSLLTEEARRLGATTAFSATEAASAMELLASAGQKPREVLATTGQALMLAGAGSVDLDTATSALASTLSQFSLDAEESGRVVDVFARATADSQFTVSDLSEAMKYGGTVGAGFGWSLEQTVAALAQFRDLGLEGTTAGTALRSAMSQAAQQTDVNRKALKKYGLDLEDVNPQLHSFQEILVTVGNAAMSTSDLMTVFGVEAGASFGQLANQAAMGSRAVDDMTVRLEDAQGAASAMYGEMQQTVAGAFAELQSAAEEVMLTVYETFRGPLAEVIGSLTAFVNQIAGSIEARGATIAAYLQKALGTVADFLAANGAELAERFAAGLVEAASFAVTLAEVAVKLGALLPILDEIALAMGAIWIAQKVAAFATTVQTVVTAFGSARVALKAFMVEMTVASGGTYALVAAIGALVAGLIVLISRYNEGAAAAERLKNAQDEISKKRASVSDERAAQLQEILDRQRAITEQEQAALAAAGQLTDERKRELEQLRELDGVTAARLEAEGKLLLVQGELRTVAGVVREMDPEAVRAVTFTIEQLRDQAKQAGGQITALKNAMAKVREETWDGTGTQAAVLFSSLGQDVANLEEAEAKLQDLTQAKKDSLARARALQEQYNDVEASLLDEEVGAQRQALEDSLAARKDANALTVAEQEEYRDETRNIRFELAQELAGLEGFLTDELGAEMAKRRREIELAYADQLTKAKDNASERARLEADLQGALTDLEQIEARKRAALQAEKDREQAKAAKDERERLLDELKRLQQEDMTESERLEQEKADTLAGITGANVDLLLQIAEEYDKKIATARDKEAEAEADRLKRLADEAEQAAKEKRDRIIKAFKEIVSGVASAVSSGLALVETYVGKLVDLFATITGFSFDLAGMVGDVQSAQESATDEGTKLSSADAATEVVDELIGGAVRLATLFGEVADDLIQGVLAGLPSVIQAFVDALPLVVAALGAAIPELVAVLGEQLPALLGMLAEQGQVLVSILASALPDLVQVIVGLLPTLVDALVLLVPQVIYALIEALPALIQGVLAVLPTLVQGLLDALPGLIQALLMELPALIRALVAAAAEIIVGIVKALPGLITAILEALPEIIVALLESILEALPEIIMALVEAIPLIIVAVLNALPEIVFAIIGAIPQIVEAVIALVPQIIVSLVRAMPQVAVALVQAFGELFSGGIDWFGDLASSLASALAGLFSGETLSGLAEAIGEAFVDGIKGAYDAIVDALSGVFEAIWDTISGWFDGDSKSSSKSRSSSRSRLGGLADMIGSAGLPVPDLGAATLGSVRASASGFGDSSRGGRAEGGSVFTASTFLRLSLDGRDIEETVFRSDSRGQTQVSQRSLSPGRLRAGGMDRGKWNRYSR